MFKTDKCWVMYLFQCLCRNIYRMNPKHTNLLTRFELIVLRNWNVWFHILSKRMLPYSGQYNQRIIAKKR